MEALPKTFVWQLLDDSSILSETVSRPKTQFLMLIVTAVFQAEMHGSILNGWGNRAETTDKIQGNVEPLLCFF